MTLEQMKQQNSDLNKLVNAQAETIFEYQRQFANMKVENMMLRDYLSISAKELKEIQKMLTP